MAVNETQNAIPIDQSNENGLGEDGKATRSFSEQWKDAKKGWLLRNYYFLYRLVGLNS